MEIIPIVHRQFSANTYLIGNKGENVLVIDPGVSSDALATSIKSQYAGVDAILLTHGHYDHMGGIDFLVKAFHCPVFIHENDASFLTNPRLNGSASFGESLIADARPITFSDDDVLNRLGVTIQTVATPFHTKGSVCFWFKELGALFTGDTLFRGDIGRTDLPTGSSKTVESSLDKLRALPENLMVFSGHGHPTTLEREKKFNRYFRK